MPWSLSTPVSCELKIGFMRFPAWNWLPMRQTDKTTLPDPLIERAKQEREKLVEQIAQSQATIEQSRELIARIDRMLAAAEKK